MKKSPQDPLTVSHKIHDYVLKSPVFPEGLIILQDTREQTPLFGPRFPKGMILMSSTLSDGDYSIRGHQDTFAIERKGMSDLLSYCTSEREKTKTKMCRFAKMEWVGLVIEVASSEKEIYRPYPFSQTSPELIRQCLVSFSIRYGIHVYIGVRENCQRWVLDHIIKFYRVKHEL